MAIQLYDYQLEALNRMKNGCILCGGVGSGKSRTGLAYYYVQEGGKVGTDEYTASGQRAMTDQKSELDNGLERMVRSLHSTLGKLTLRAMTAATSSLTMRGSATPTITALWSLLRTLSRVRTKNYI